MEMFNIVVAIGIAILAGGAVLLVAAKDKEFQLAMHQHKKALEEQERLARERMQRERQRIAPPSSLAEGSGETAVE